MIRTFDRIPRFDARNFSFPAGALMFGVEEPVSAWWPCAICLDQGREGACTGHAVAHEAAAEPVAVPGITGAVAFEVYRRAKQIDEWPGEDYEGSSVLAAMKAGKERGWYDEYRWAFSEDELAFAIGRLGPAVLGIDWHEGMSSPGTDGLIRPTGPRLGGHAILCNGYDALARVYRLHNSWGPGWGMAGECFISAADLAGLLARDGDACIPVVRKYPSDWTEGASSGII